MPLAEASAPVALTPIDGPELQQVLQAHLRWTESGGTEGARASLREMDLSYYDLSGAVLAGANLKGADFTGCNLTGADLHGADCMGANFTRANLTKSILFGAQFNDACFQGANLTGAELSAAHCANARFTEANFAEASLDGVQLREADLTRAAFKGANLNKSNLKGARLEGTSFADADLTGADLRGAVCKGTLFDRARLDQTQFKDAVLEGVDFTLADFLQVGEINEEYRQLSLQAERWRLDQEKAKLAQARTELEAAHQRLLQKKMVVADWKRGENEFIVKSAIHAVWMKYLAIGWGVVAALFTLVTLYQAFQIPWENLRLRELVVVLGIVSAISAMFIITTLRAYKVARMMNHYGGFFRQKLGSLIAIQAGVPMLDQTATSEQTLALPNAK